MRLFLPLLLIGGLACGTGASSTGSGGGASSGGHAASGGASATGGASAAGGDGATGGQTSGPGGGETGGASAGTGGQGPGGGAGSGGGGVGGGGGGDGTLGSPCTWGGAPCNSGLYCYSTNCGAGTCTPILTIGAQQKNLAPVCGCDGVTYFNASIAQSRAMSESHLGACSSVEDVACSSQSPCAAGLFCNRGVTTASQCSMASGRCWGVPFACDTLGAAGRGCGAPMLCADICSLIQSQNPWTEDLTCP
ncbi:MAG: hypothetical protein KC731_12280 [Myxococcales bacterium]|nr:hypothetical protein [Myxococcales bacterium]